jgi:predicted kinase
MAADGVLVLSGPPCSGKSTVGRLLAGGSLAGRRTTYVEVDALFSLLLPTSDRSRADRMLAYDAAHHLALMLLERESTVILECTYARSEQRLSLVEMLRNAPDAPLRVVEFCCTADQAVERFRHRREGTDLDEEAVRERVEAFPYSEQAFRLSDSAASPDELARMIEEWLPAQPLPVDQVAWAKAGRAWN